MRIGVGGLAALVSLLGASALAVAFPAMATSPKQKSEKMICKGQPTPGSRFRTRICHTSAEWDQIAEENRRSMQDMTTRNIKACGPMTGCD